MTNRRTLTKAEEEIQQAKYNKIYLGEPIQTVKKSNKIAICYFTKDDNGIVLEYGGAIELINHSFYDIDRVMNVIRKNMPLLLQVDKSKLPTREEIEERLLIDSKSNPDVKQIYVLNYFL